MVLHNTSNQLRPPNLPRWLEERLQGLADVIGKWQIFDILTVDLAFQRFEVVEKFKK